MKRYRVGLTATVDNQILDQALYIADGSVSRAVAWDARARAALRTIGDAPRGDPFDEEATQRCGLNVYRFVFERTFLAHYTVDDRDETVTVVNFRHGARLPNPGEP